MKNISKVYRTDVIETHALRELDLHVKEGEFVSVTGPSGSGKTTFLNITGLLETFSSGDYILDDVNNKEVIASIKDKVIALTAQFPVYIG